MTIRVSNTRSGEREQFEPLHEDEVLLYVCGLTTSDPVHLGHARLWVHADVVHRWLEYRGYDVRHVENFTDVNEKIVARVGERGESEADVARNFIESTIKDMRSLNLKRATVYPRVSGHVPEIIDLIERLIERGYAYESNGSVYFDTTAFPEYGALSNQSIEDLQAQGPDDEQREKRHPTDFALWKANGVAPEEIEEHRHEGAGALSAEEAVETAQTWDAPWGEGRPGWHIECSAMATAHLGETIDIHMGGQDLVFPHHENEIAQSEAATGETFARYWLHLRLLDTGEEKMSSSLGNFWTLHDAVESVGPNAVRTFLISASYTSPQTFSEEALHEATERWDRLQRAYESTIDALDSPDAVATPDEELRTAVENARSSFEEAMDDDFNTRGALSALLELATATNSHVGEAEEYDYGGLRDAAEVFETLGGTLGLCFGDTGDRRKSIMEGDSGSDSVQLAREAVELVLDLRQSEREAGNYERADSLREALTEIGVEVEDTDDGPVYRLP